MTGARAAGVYRAPTGKRWRAEIDARAGDAGSKRRKLGVFVNEVDAALAYDQAAREHHKDKAKLNFPDLPPQPQVVVNRTPRKGSSQYRGKAGEP
jgi:hypothetical protein